MTNKISSFFQTFLKAPLALWMIFFLILPLLFVLAMSLAQMSVYGEIQWGLSFENYQKLITFQNLRIFLKSFQLALMTSIIGGVVAIPLTWAMSTAPASMRQRYLILICLPFLSNLVIRLYAIRVFVGYDGALPIVLRLFKIDFDPFALTQNQYLVVFAMVTTYLPFFILPLFAAFERFDFLQVEAAQDLGARSFRILFEIIFPQLKRPLLSGFILVFIPSFGEFLIPDLMGGAKSMRIGNLITHQFLKARDWPMGSVLAVAMMGILIILFVAVQKTMDRAKES